MQIIECKVKTPRLGFREPAGRPLFYHIPHLLPVNPPSPYEVLAEALHRRREVISDQDLRRNDPAAQLRKLEEVSHAITVAQRKLPPPVDPQLQHFLQRCSYDKALAFLEGSPE